MELVENFAENGSYAVHYATAYLFRWLHNHREMSQKHPKFEGNFTVDYMDHIAIPRIA